MNPTQSHSHRCRACCISGSCLFDDFYHEILVLENSVHGLCNWLKLFDEMLADEKQLGAMVQIDRVKKMLDEF